MYGTRGIRKFSVLSIQYCCDPKTAKTKKNSLYEFLKS